MLKINNVLFELSNVYENLSQAKTWDMTNILTEIKSNLESLIEDVKQSQLYEDQYKEHIDLVNKQLFYVNSNIKTLQDALLCHETKFIQKRTGLGDLGVFCLN